MRDWAGVRWRQELDARPVLVYPTIPDVEGDAKCVGKVAGSGG